MDVKNLIMAVLGYLLGLAFAGSFIGRKWMGKVDIALCRLFKQKITTTRYIYWRHFCLIEDAPMPKNIKTLRKIMKFLGVA